MIALPHLYLAARSFVCGIEKKCLPWSLNGSNRGNHDGSQRSAWHNDIDTYDGKRYRAQTSGVRNEGQVYLIVLTVMIGLVFNHSKWVVAKQEHEGKFTCLLLCRAIADFVCELSLYG